VLTLSETMVRWREHVGDSDARADSRSLLTAGRRYGIIFFLVLFCIGGMLSF
jgi:hypothetical protein